MKEYKMLPLRLIVLPFIFATVLIFSLWKILVFAFNFLLYGGELIALAKKNDHRTINDVYEKVQELINKSNP